MSGQALSIRPVLLGIEKDYVLSELQADPDEILDYLQVGDTVYIVFKEEQVRDRIEFLNGSELFDAVVTVQRETLNAVKHARNPETPKPAPVPVSLPRAASAAIGDPSDPSSLLGKLQVKTLPARAALPEDDAYNVLSRNFGIVTLAILTVLAISSLLG